MSDLEEIIQGLRDEFDSKPEWFKAIAGALPVTGQLAALHEYDKAVKAGESEDAIMAALGGLPLVGMAGKSVTLSKNAKKVSQHNEMVNTPILARALSNLGFGVGAGQSSARTAQEELQRLKSGAADNLMEQAAFTKASGGERL